MEYIQSYNANFSEERDLIDSLIYLPSQVKSFKRAFTRTKGMNIFLGTIALVIVCLGLWLVIAII